MKPCRFPTDVRVISGEDAETFGLNIKMNREIYREKETNQSFSIFSISIKNSSFYFIEILFATLITKPKKPNSFFRKIGNVLYSSCSKRRSKRKNKK